MGSKQTSLFKEQDQFSVILRKAYERGISDNSITVSKMIEELKSDLQNIIVS